MDKLFRKIGKFAPIFKDNKPKKPLQKKNKKIDLKRLNKVFILLQTRFQNA